ncbi:MAG: acyl carrier protein [Polyangiaceae bacterium]|nr:acyl carrier protein [Polyangiaceae bacterium]
MEKSAGTSWGHEAVVKELMRVLEVHTEHKVELRESTELVGELGIDSLGVMEVVAELEDKFGLTIADDDLREVETVGDVARAVETRLRADGRWSE